MLREYKQPFLVQHYGNLDLMSTKAINYSWQRFKVWFEP